MNEIYYITKLKDFQKVLIGTTLPDLKEIKEVPIRYIKTSNQYSDYLFFDCTKTSFPENPQLAGSRFLQRMQLLEALSNHYVPIYDLKTNNLLFTLDAYLDIRHKMFGLKSYGLPFFIFSENLFFKELTPYLNHVEENLKKINMQQTALFNELTKIVEPTGLSFTKDLELIGIGSTSRGTNIPDFQNYNNSDFDFVIRLSSSHLNIVRETILNGLLKENQEALCKKNTPYRLRLLNVKIPFLSDFIDIDISFMTQKKTYLSTEKSILEKLTSMKEQDYEKYKLVLANIMFAKDFLKGYGVYKPARALPEYAKSIGGLGGIGIENWLLQNGGSFIDAAKEFTAMAQNKDFLTFISTYPIMDFGQNHVFVSQDKFPYDNFVPKNMGPNGYKIMNNILITFLKDHQNILEK